jgi:hypothetical protein
MIRFSHTANSWQVQLYSRNEGFFWIDTDIYNARRYFDMGYKLVME